MDLRDLLRGAWGYLGPPTHMPPPAPPTIPTAAPATAVPETPSPIKEPPMSILSQTIFDPIKAELGQDVAPLIDTFFADLQAAAQKFTSTLPSTVAGQSGALALNTIIGLAGVIGPTLLHAELAKVIPSMPAAPAVARAA